jgi:hypothetical protein
LDCDGSNLQAQGEVIVTYEEKLEAMAEAMWQAENVRMMGRPRLVEWAEAGDHQHVHWRASARAAAETIRLREIMIKAQNWEDSFKDHGVADFDDTMVFAPKKSKITETQRDFTCTRNKEARHRLAVP